ncbi:MAG: hypothetical protein J6U46_06525, partial [Bacteroidaceae bacterium]|nr:hypothetical protein [Bacteroidaceae bacterium]
MEKSLPLPCKPKPQTKMKKPLILLLATLLTICCSNNTKHTEAYIRQRIDTIYKGVGQAAYEYEGRDSTYCSQRYYALMTEAGQLCDEAEEMLYDYDHWICGQDWSDDWSYTIDTVYNITDTTALADLTIHNFGDSKTTIALLFERDDWYIDDFSPSPDGNDD